MSNEEETGYYIGFKMHKGCLKKNVLLYYYLSGTLYFLRKVLNFQV